MKDSIPVLDFETSIHNNVLISSVQAINKYLEEKLQDIIEEDTSQNNFLTWHENTVGYTSGNYPDGGDLVTTITVGGSGIIYTPTYEGAPDLETIGSLEDGDLKIKIPYQINFCYLDKDQDPSRVIASDPVDGPMPTEPNLRTDSISSPVTVDGDTRQMPGKRRTLDDTDREFFDKIGSIQIFYMQPLYEYVDDVDSETELLTKRTTLKVENWTGYSETEIPISTTRTILVNNWTVNYPLEIGEQLKVEIVHDPVGDPYYKQIHNLGTVISFEEVPDPKQPQYTNLAIVIGDDSDPDINFDLSNPSDESWKNVGNNGWSIFVFQGIWRGIAFQANVKSWTDSDYFYETVETTTEIEQGTYPTLGKQIIDDNGILGTLLDYKIDEIDSSVMTLTIDGDSNFDILGSTISHIMYGETVDLPIWEADVIFDSIEQYFVTTEGNIVTGWDNQSIPPPILSEKKIVVLDRNLDPVLKQLIEQSKTVYDLFEEMINGVEDFSGSYSDTVNNYESIIDSINRRDRFLLRNQIFREFSGI